MSTIFLEISKYKAELLGFYAIDGEKTKAGCEYVEEIYNEIRSFNGLNFGKLGVEFSYVVSLNPHIIQIYRGRQILLQAKKS
jgi:hypothetical protein